MILGVDSRIAFTALIAVIAVQRLWELEISKRNVERLLARGGIEVGSDHYPWMVVLHTAFLFSCLAEVWMLDRPWRPLVGLASMLVLIAALGLRWWTLSVLDDRWTTRVIAVSGETLVTSGPFRWFRHPNYLAVVLEIAAIPMLHWCWLTAVTFSIANGALLAVRLSVEDRALDRSAGGGP